MTDYTELVRVLRGLANGTWKNCEYTWFAGEEKVFAADGKRKEGQDEGACSL